MSNPMSLSLKTNPNTVTIPQGTNISLSNNAFMLIRQVLHLDLRHVRRCHDDLYSWLIPPSATSSAPTKNVDSSEARNTAAWAISCGSAKRLMGTCCTMLDTRASRASEVNPMIGRLKIGVVTGPGLITLTR